MSIGIGVITCNRPEFLNNLLNSLKDCSGDITRIVIINDGSEPIDISTIQFKCDSVEIVNNTSNLGVGESKNIAMSDLCQHGCDYIFIIEDDMLILKSDIFEEYIRAHKLTGLHHFMFAYHGPANKGGISRGKPLPRKIIDYKDIKISLNQHCVGAFCFYTKECLEETGLNDTAFVNAFEHVEHSYRLAKADYSTPYWWWADIANSIDYITEQACSEDSSSIRPRKDWKSNIQKAMNYFVQKHGMSPVQVPDTPLEHVLLQLKKIKP